MIQENMFLIFALTEITIDSRSMELSSHILELDHQASKARTVNYCSMTSKYIS